MKRRGAVEGRGGLVALAGGVAIVAGLFGLAACRAGSPEGGSGAATASPDAAGGTPTTVVPTSPVATVAAAEEIPTFPVLQTTPGAPAPVFSYEVVNRFPHDPNAFTQGLVYADGIFYEGTGIYGESTLRKVDPESGDVILSVDLPDQFFGEGITLWGEDVVQLTWREKVAFVNDKATFTGKKSWNYQTEGWGMTTDGSELIMSDGTPILYFRNPDTFDVTRTVQVTDGGVPVDDLNELEYIDGEIWANVWTTDRIVVIDPSTGVVNATVDLTGLLPPEDHLPGTDVLNGIAYDPATERLFVTGKKWPTLFEIKLVPPRTGALPPSLLPIALKRS